LGWLRSFRGFVGDKEPENLSASDIRNFLSFLAVKRTVSAAAQSKALNVLVFFYRNVLDKDPTDELGAVRAMPGRPSHLRHVRLGRRRYTTQEWLEEWIQRVASEPEGASTLVGQVSVFREAES